MPLTNEQRQKLLNDAIDIIMALEERADSLTAIKIEELFTTIKEADLNDELDAEMKLQMDNYLNEHKN